MIRTLNDEDRWRVVKWRRWYCKNGTKAMLVKNEDVMYVMRTVMSRELNVPPLDWQLLLETDLRELLQCISSGASFVP